MKDLSQKVSALGEDMPFSGILLNRLDKIEDRLISSTQQISGSLNQIRCFDPPQGIANIGSEMDDLSTAVLMKMERIEWALLQLEHAKDHLKTIV